MRKRLTYGLVLGLLFSSLTWAENLRLVANPWPPFSDRNLPHNGVAIDLIRTALDRAGYRSEYIEVPWARAINGLQNDRYDIVACAWFAEDRAKYGQFSEPYLINRIRFLQRTGSNFSFNQLSDLYPYTLAVTRGYAYDPSFDSDAQLNKVEVTDFQIAARMLTAGRVQLTLEDEWVVKSLFSSELKDIRDRVKFLPKPLSETPLHILVRRSHPQHEQIIRGFNQALFEMREDGTYQRILKRHHLDTENTKSVLIPKHYPARKVSS